MGFLNKKDILIAAAVGVAIRFISEPFLKGWHTEDDAIGFGFGSFILCAIVLHIKPELMGNLNKTDDEEEKPLD